MPNAELKRVIYDAIAPTVKTFRDKIDAQWAKAKADKKLEEEKRSAVATGHETAENIAKHTPTDKSAIDKGKNLEKESAALVAQLKRDATATEQAAWVAKFQGQPFTIVEDGWKGPTFVEAHHMGGRDVLRYNLTHPFFEEVYRILQGLEGGPDELGATGRLKALLDLLIMAYSKAEAKFDANTTFTAEEFVEHLRSNWGMYLQNYLRTWQREHGND